MKRLLLIATATLLIGTLSAQGLHTSHSKKQPVKGKNFYSYSMELQNRHSATGAYIANLPIQNPEALSVKKVLDTMVYYGWVGTWIESEMSVHQYDANWRNIRSTDFEKDGSSWAPYWKEEYGYTPAGLLSFNYSFEWSGSSWDTISTLVNTYNGSNQLLTQVTAYADNGQMVPDRRINFSYNASQLIQQEIHQQWDGSLWEDFMKITYTHNAANKMATQSYFMFSSSTWELMSVSHFSYDANGFLAMQLDSMWNGTQMFPDHKIEYTNKPNGDPLTIIEYYTGGSGWDPSNKSEYTYDANGNVANLTEYSFQGSSWLPEYKLDLTYNNSFAFSDLVLPNLVAEDPILFKHMLTDVINLGYDGSTWLQDMKIVLKYSTHGSGVSVPEHSNPSVSIYPNPSNGRVNVDFDSSAGPLQFELLDMQGRLVYSGRIEAPSAINLESVAGGLYLYRVLTSDNQVGSGKLLFK